jgi:plastocyanin domain-containing protein
MKNTTIAVIFILVILSIGAFFFLKGNAINGNVVNTNSGSGQNGDVQKVIIGMKNYNYYPQTITMKAGVPVSISLDSSAVGCSRYFTIPQLKLQKSLPSPSDTLDFTPTQKGTYRFQCGMGMYYGTLIVE